MKKPRLPLAYYQRSLKTWLGKLTFRRGKLAGARRQARRGGSPVTAAEAARINNWKREVAEAERWVARRRREIAAKKPKVPAGRAACVRRARSYVGVREHYRNGGGIINTWQRRLGFGNVAWCGIFCGNMLMQVGVRGVSSRIAAVARIEDDARRGRGPFIGWTSSTRAAKPADLAVIGSYGQHVGMVESVNSDGSLNTIEGNAGDAVRRMRRRPSQVRGIARVRLG